MLRAESPKRTTRRQRSCERKRHQTHNGTILGALRAIFYAELRPATIFHSSRILTLLLGHVTIATVLTIVYYHVHIDSAHSEAANFVPGIKDFADLCVTGIVFLLGGFVTTMLTRWWAVRSQCCGALHQSLSNLNMYAAAVWSTNDPIDRETRALLSRYAVAAYQLLFIEARAADLVIGDDQGVEKAVQRLIYNGSLMPAEVEVLNALPSKSCIVIGWIAAFFEQAMNPNSGLAASSRFPRNSDNGRYSIIYGQIFAAQNAISLCHMYMQTQLPYGYIHLILIMVQLTSLANSIFCGIHLGQTMKQAQANGDAVQIWIPLIFVRVMRIIFIPLLLDGMLFIGHVISMPLGDDDDDFPAGSFIEDLEDDCLACGAALEQFHPASLLTKKDEEKKE